MNYQAMMNKAKLYQEATETLNRKPQLIQSAESHIYNLEKEIAALEEKALKATLNESISKMNPLKFFAKKEEDYDTQIIQLEMEIKKEQRKIDGLKNAKTTEYINLEAVTEEALQIMGEQSKVIETHKQKVLAAQAAYHAAIGEYKNELDSKNSFVMRVRGFEETVKSETFIPSYPRERPYVDNRLNHESFSAEIITNHLQRPNLTAKLFA